MRRAASPICATLLFFGGTSAFAAREADYSIPSLPLDQSIIRLGQQAGVSIGGSDTAIPVAIGNAVRGRMSLKRALRKLLDRTGYAFVMVDARTVRIVRSSPPSRDQVKARQPPLRDLRAQAPAPDLPSQDIVVTASKQDQTLANYAGSAHVEKVGAIGLKAEGGTAALLGRLPELLSTNLGPGRNKLFVRGIADSSFSGPTQSTVGLYLGELRLTYNAPEPDLRLYDIDNIEVIEGPQGTLYGAGALGGIVRIMPNTPEAGTFHVSGSVGYAVTANGRASYDVGGTLNIPVFSDHVVMRVVGYKQRLGGYIDNATLGTRDTNTTRIVGGRAMIRLDPGNGWKVDLSALRQNIDTRDGQYADRGLPALTHAAAIAQPHDNDFLAANLVVTKRWDRMELVSSTGVVKHGLSERFDASGLAGMVGVTAYDRNEAIRMMTHETRLSSRGSGRRSWVTGFSYVSNIDRIAQALGQPSTPVELSNIRNEKSELAAFGEATVPLASKWSLTGGSRVVFARTTGQLLGRLKGSEPSRHEIRVLPTLALAWKPNDYLQVFARLRSGFRSGGIAVDPEGNVAKFDSDQILTGETGLRVGRSGNLFSGSAAVFYSRWRDIQADLLDNRGFPVTANIGNGHVFGIGADLSWRPIAALLIEGTLFVNRSRLDSPTIELIGLDRAALPNVPRFGGRASVRYTRPLSPDLSLILDGTARYRSASSVGTVPPLLLEQGEYFEADMAAAIDAGKWKLSVDVTNVFDGKENSFAFGNPFTASLGTQETPLRPRTVRLGVTFGF
jgi:outer membrane receptor protein involved in Fe transport